MLLFFRISNLADVTLGSCKDHPWHRARCQEEENREVKGWRRRERNGSSMNGQCLTLGELWQCRALGKVGWETERKSSSFLLWPPKVRRTKNNSYFLPFSPPLSLYLFHSALKPFSPSRPRAFNFSLSFVSFSNCQQCLALVLFRSAYDLALRVRTEFFAGFLLFYFFFCFNFILYFWCLNFYMKLLACVCLSLPPHFPIFRVFLNNIFNSLVLHSILVNTSTPSPIFLRPFSPIFHPSPICL